MFHKKNCLEATQLESKRKPSRKNIDLKNPKEDHKEFIKNNKLIVKTQQGFKSEKYNAFTKKMIALRSNDDKRIQSIDSLETYAYGTSKDLVSEKRRD